MYIQFIYVLVHLLVLYHNACNLRGRRVPVHRTAPVDLDVILVAIGGSAHPLVRAVSHEVCILPDCRRELGYVLGPDICLCGDGLSEGIERRDRGRCAQRYGR